MNKHLGLIVLLFNLIIGNAISQETRVPMSSFKIVFLEDNVNRYEVVIASNDSFNEQLLDAKQLLLRESSINEKQLESLLQRNYGISSYKNQIINELDFFPYYRRYTRIFIYIRYESIWRIIINQCTTVNNDNERQYDVSMRTYE